jgi:glucose-1-phosphate cytidylyltransferase
MKLFILAGGYGSRLGHITEAIPKPMVEIGGKPILWHIMKYYSTYGVKEFVVLLGYKGKVIKNYFYNYYANNRNFEINLATGETSFLENSDKEDWKVTLLDTGLDNLKGSRIKQAESLMGGVNFMTYGDGVCDVDLDQLMSFHKKHGKTVTMTGVHPPSRFGELNLEGNKVVSFEEKPQISTGGLINGGFMIFNKNMLDTLSLDKDCDFEFGPLEGLAQDGEIMVYKHDGEWECIDTERDLNYLNKVWNNGNAFWKKW